jgi:hypothetical protein
MDGVHRIRRLAMETVPLGLGALPARLGPWRRTDDLARACWAATSWACWAAAACWAKTSRALGADSAVACVLGRALAGDGGSGVRSSWAGGRLVRLLSGD